MAIDPSGFGPYSMAVFLAHQSTGPDTGGPTVRHHEGPPTLLTAPSIGPGDEYEQFLKPPLGTRRTVRNPDPALDPQVVRHTRTRTVVLNPLADRTVISVSPGLLENIYYVTAGALEVKKRDLKKNIVLDYQLDKVEAAFLGMPAGNYYVGNSRFDSGDDESSADGSVSVDPLCDQYGPLLYHTVGQRALHIHDLTRSSETYGPPYRLKIDVLLNHVGTPKESVLLKCIRANCLTPAFVRVNERAKLAVHLSMAVTWRTGCSSQMVDLVQFLVADPAVRDYVRDNRLLPGAAEFWRSYWFNLESKLEPDAMDVEFAEVHTRRAETVELKPDYGNPFAARVKDIKYGNANALVEHAALWLYALSGLHAPHANIAQRAQSLFGGFDAASRRDYSLHGDEPDRFCVIVSRLLPQFKDLGLLLTHAETMHELIAPEDRARYGELLATYTHWNDAFHALQALPPNDDGTPAQLAQRRHANGKRLEALQAMYPLLPRSMRDDVATSYLVSHWLMNWDVVNIGLANLGFYREHGSGRWVSAAVDFGNSLTLGFGGRNKEDSWDTAGSARGLNDTARPDDPDPLQRTHTPNVIDRRWTGDLRYGPRPPANVPRRDGGGSVDVKVTSSFTDIGNLPRIPVAMLVQQQIQAETFAVGMDDGGWTTRQDDPSPRPPVRPNHGTFKPLGEKREAPYLARDFAPFVEAAFRLSLVPDEALEAMTLKVWPWQGPKTEALTQKFCPRTGTDLPNHVELAQRLAERRDQIVAQFDIERWAETHPDKAEKVYAEVFAAVLGLTNIVIPPHDWGTRDDSGNRSGASSRKPNDDLVVQYGIEDPEPRSRERPVEELVARVNSRTARLRERVTSRPEALQRRLQLLVDRANQLEADPQVARCVALMRQREQLGTVGVGSTSLSLSDRADRRIALAGQIDALGQAVRERGQDLLTLQATLIPRVQMQLEQATRERAQYLDEDKSGEGSNA